MDMIIREERREDWYETEYMTKKAFWNLHCPGADEHYLVYKMRDDKAYLPHLSRVAEVDGKVVGTIMYVSSFIDTGEEEIEVLCFGPLCVDPEYQGKGVGGRLLTETSNLAKKEGYRGVIIFGEPEYYPKFGFVPCDQFGITTKKGKNFSSFMAIELQKGGLQGIHGKFYEADVYNHLPKEEVEEYDKRFPFMEKLVLPGQWQEN